MPDRQLAVENVSVYFGPEHARTAAVDNVSLEFKPGTLTVIMGPSGSGKTTLLSLLGVLLRPDKGNVYLDGNDISSLNEDERTSLRRNQVGFVFQAFRLLHALSAIDNALIARDIRGERNKQDRETAANLLTELGLGGKLVLKPKELSGGEKQRVAIARALLGIPRCYWPMSRRLRSTRTRGCRFASCSGNYRMRGNTPRSWFRMIRCGRSSPIGWLVCRMGA